MFLTPYQTTACSAYEVKGIQSALQRAEIHGDLAPAVTLKGTTLKGVYIVPPYVKDIAPFSMPLTFEGQHGTSVAVDVRGLTKAIGDHQYKVVAGAEYEGAIIRAALTLGWIQGGANDMRRFNDISAKVFIRLLSESLSRRLNLGPYEQQALTVVTGLFYYSNFIDYAEVAHNGTLPKEEKDKVAVAVSRLTRINPQTVADFLSGDLPLVTNLDGYCEALRVVVKSPRLERVDAALIMTLMGGLWFGGNARQLMAVGLEYPPVWLAMIYQALTDRSFHGAGLTKMVEAEDRNKAGANFMRDVGSYLEIINDE